MTPSQTAKQCPALRCCSCSHCTIHDRRHTDTELFMVVRLSLRGTNTYRPPKHRCLTKYSTSPHAYTIALCGCKCSANLPPPRFLASQRALTATARYGPRGTPPVQTHKTTQLDTPRSLGALGGTVRRGGAVGGWEHTHLKTLWPVWRGRGCGELTRRDCRRSPLGRRIRPAAAPW